MAESNGETKQNLQKHNPQRIHGKSKGKVHPCTGTEALYRPYGP